MDNLFLHFIENYGNIGIFLLIFIENLFPPIPSEAILGIGGFFISQTQLSFVSVLLSATLGSILGAIALYYIGRYINSPRIRNIFLGEGKLLRLGNDKLSKIKKIYVKHQKVSVFLLRMVPIFRSIISIPAGMFRMNFLEFILLTSLGSLIWNGIIIYAGMYLGENWAFIEKIMKNYTYLIVIVVALILMVYLYKRRKENKNSDKKIQD
ncbi:DedA family protein [Lagierella sp.]|uniref:DedA family protein n=1 Tax=Lagierella sp. TaxID=2849657 RepID=UPI0026383885|nr:DedA family protein [Lagierella sp.]